MLKDLVETFVWSAVYNSEIGKYWDAILKKNCFLKDLIVELIGLAIRMLTYRLLKILSPYFERVLTISGMPKFI